MTYEKKTINVGHAEHEVIHCIGEGQCQCKSCKDRGIYNVSWTSWFYKLDEADKGVLCIDCIREILIQRRIDDAVKDTARELAKTIKSVVWEEFENETIRIKDLHGVIDDILRSKYGVEVE